MNNRLTGLGATSGDAVTPVLTAGSVPQLPLPIWQQRWQDQANRTAGVRKQALTAATPSTTRIMAKIDAANAKLREAKATIDRSWANGGYFTRQNELFISERLDAAKALTNDANHMLYLEQLAAKSAPATDTTRPATKAQADAATTGGAGGFLKQHGLKIGIAIGLFFVLKKMKVIK